MKKVLTLIAAAVTAVILFAAVSVGEIFLVSLIAIYTLPIFILFSYIAFAAVSFGFAFCIVKVKRFLVKKISVLPLSYYIVVFLPSLVFSGVSLIRFLQKLNDGYYDKGAFIDIERQLAQYFVTSYFAFTLLTAAFVFFISLYGRKKEKLNRQVEEYIHEHEG